MPSSLTKVLPLILGFSPFLPVSVCGTGIFSLDSGFSWQCELVFFSTCFSIPIIPYFSEDTDLPISSGLVFGRTLPCRAVKLILLRPHFSMATIDSTGISTSCPSTTLFSLILGPDLPWGDEPCPGNLRFSTGEILTHLLATHASILSCIKSTPAFAWASSLIQCSSTTCIRKSTTSVLDLAPEIFGAKSLDQ